MSLTIQPRIRDLGGFSVHRVLPITECRHVGPFVFFDHLGHAEFAPGDGINVRAHPHIGLATITYLFEGELLHKDSLGNEQIIQPGAINLMISGKGIVHAELTPQALLDQKSSAHALQLWVALPDNQEECEPSFHHYDVREIPQVSEEGKSIRVLMGEAFGKSSPVKTLSPTLYLEVKLESGKEFTLPATAENPERAVYLVSGELDLAGDLLLEHQMRVYEPSEAIELKATRPSQLVIIGGKHVGDRNIYWNFVSSSKSRIEEAKTRWKEGRFPPVPGETEFIPLPD